MKTMKRILVAMACVCMLAACSKSDDVQVDGQKQLKSNETKTYVFKNIDFEYWAPVICDGVEVDVLTGTIQANIIVHYDKGDLKWYMYHWDGEVTSDLNGEVFQVHESDKIGIPIPDVYTYHFNLVGNMGSHYINFATLNMVDWTITVDNAVCPGN